MKVSLRDTLTGLVASARPVVLYPTPTEEAEEIKYVEALLTRLPDEMIAVAKQGRTSIDVMQIEQRHCGRMYYAYRFPLLGAPRYKDALQELKGAAEVAVKWIQGQGLEPAIRRDKRYVNYGDGGSSMWYEEVLTATWPRRASVKRTAAAA